MHTHRNPTPAHPLRTPAYRCRLRPQRRPRHPLRPPPTPRRRDHIRVRAHGFDPIRFFQDRGVSGLQLPRARPSALMRFAQEHDVHTCLVTDITPLAPSPATPPRAPPPPPPPPPPSLSHPPGTPDMVSAPTDPGAPPARPEAPSTTL